MVDTTQIKIQAFRAVNNPEACKLFYEGHQQVLADYGVKYVTSSNQSWFYDPGVYVILVKSLNGKETFGGARIHIAGSEPLPIEGAIGEMDPRIYELTRGNSPEIKVAEMCGLWNTRNMAGTGLSVLLIKSCMAKAGVVIANQLKINIFFALCSPFTVQMIKDMGFSVEESIGDRGRFLYPNPELIATVMSLDDTEILVHAKTAVRKSIVDLRKKPRQRKIEEGPKGKLNIDYDLTIQDI
jgi:hypothetical protein